MNFILNSNQEITNANRIERALEYLEKMNPSSYKKFTDKEKIENISIILDDNKDTIRYIGKDKNGIPVITVSYKIDSDNLNKILN